jgi:hypothetical protein
MNGIDTGTYVELGAFQGRAESNSAFFDLCLGWKGLLIEGNPAHYSKLVQNRLLNRQLDRRASGRLAAMPT